MFLSPLLYFDPEFPFWLSVPNHCTPESAPLVRLREVFPSRVTPMAEERTGSASRRYKKD
jgi:hypothetical protein